MAKQENSWERGAPLEAPLRFALVGPRVHRRPAGPDPFSAAPAQYLPRRSPPGAVIVAHSYDVESGRKHWELRGRGTAHERFNIPVPRDGGIRELIEEAPPTDRSFDAVICESIERIARRTYYGTKHDLEQAGVALFAADERILLNGNPGDHDPDAPRQAGSGRVVRAGADGEILGRLPGARALGLERRTATVRLPGREDSSSCSRPPRRGGPRASWCPIPSGRPPCTRCSCGGPCNVSARWLGRGCSCYAILLCVPIGDSSGCRPASASN